jgi:hypothetical protein
VATARRRWVLADHREVRHLPRLRRQHAAEQRAFDRLPDAGALPRHERAHDGEGERQRRRVVGDCATCGQRSVPLAGDRHQAAHRLRQDIVPRLAAERALGPESRGTCVDDARVHGTEGVVAEPQLLHDAGPEVVRDDVAVARQAQRHLAPLLALQVELDALLAAVDREEVGAEPIPPVDAEQPPDLAALPPLHLDHLRAHVRQQQRRIRPLLGDREIEDAYSVERSGHGEASWVDEICQRIKSAD